MNNIPPILPIAGTSDALLKAINDRLRLIDTSGQGVRGPSGKPGTPGAPGEGGGGAVTDAPNVVIDGAEVREVYDGSFEIKVTWHPDMAATPETFRGAAVYVEDPDISSAADAPMDNTQTMDGTAQLSGEWQPKRETDTFESPAGVTVPGKDAEREIRIYLASFGPASNPKLVRANAVGGSPSIKITVPPRTIKYVKGQEYAWLVTDASVLQIDDFENPDGPKYHLVFSYTPPDPSIPLPPGMGPFAGAQIVYEYDDGNRAQAYLLAVDHPEEWISDNYDAVGSGHFRVWFVSVDDAGNQNTIVPGVTPVVDVTVTYPPPGEASAPDVLAFTLSNSRHEAQPDGTIYAMADLTWENPDSPRYALTTFYRIDPLPIRQLAVAPAPLTNFTLQIIDWPKTTAVWTIAAIPSDTNGVPAADPNVLPLPAHIPTVIWHIGPPGLGGSGEEYTTFAGVGGVVIDTEQTLSSDGIQMMRHKITGWTNPTDNSFGGVSIARVYSGDIANATWWDAAKSDTALTTGWEPAPAARHWDFYFVSRDLQNHRNTILPGFTPVIRHPLTGEFVPLPGNIVLSRMPKDWFNTDEFVWPEGSSGKFSALSFVASKIFVGSILRVGGGTAGNAASFGGFQNGQIAVYNADTPNKLRAWMGQQSTGTPDNPSFHTVFGGWFAELYVGGDDPRNAPIYVRQDGTAIVGGFAAPTTPGIPARYPYISIRDDHGFEVGRMGASIGYAPTGNQPGPELTIHGAWFRDFAYGGTTFTDWRMLAKTDVTRPDGASVTMRNINKFTIDYAQNYQYPSPSPNPNAPVRLEFGYDAYVTSSLTYKFPGITIYRQSSTGASPTTHGIDIVNRGIILKGQNTLSNGSPALGAFVTFNGDSAGSDVPSTFWAELSMRSPTDGSINVLLSSGAVSGAAAGVGSAGFYLKNQSGITMFQVAGAGSGTTGIPVVCAYGVSVGSFGTVIHGFSPATFYNQGDVHAANVYASSFNIGFPSASPSSNIPVINNAGTIRTPDDIHASDYFVYKPDPGGFDIWVIDGTNGQLLTSVKAAGGVWANTDVRAPAFFVGPTSGPWVQGYPYSGTSTFTTADGKTVTVRAGLITNIA